MSDTEITKDVNMVAYDAEQQYGTVREWAGEVVGVDLTGTEMVTTEYAEITVDLGRGEHNFTLQDYNYTDDELEEARQSLNSPHVSIDKVENRTTSYEKNINSSLMDFLVILCKVIPDEFTAGGVQFETDPTHFRRLKWESEDGEHQLKIKRRNAKKRRVLAKEEARESDDLYETMAEVPSIKIRIDMQSTSKEVIDDLSEGIVPKLHKELSKVDAVGKVRYMACEVQETKKGECYNI